MKKTRILAVSMLSVTLLAGCVANGSEHTQNSNVDIEGNVSSEKDTIEVERVTKWSEDIELLSSELKRVHKDLYKDISEISFDAEIELLQNRVSYLNDDELILEIMRLIARIGDGHTYLEWYNNFNERGLPIKFARIEDEIYCVNATEEYGDLLFKRIIAIEGEEIESVYSDLMELVPAENDYWREVNALGLLRRPMFFNALKLTDNDDYTSLTYDEDGLEKHVEIKNMVKGETEPQVYVFEERINNVVSNIDMLDSENYWYEHDIKNKILKINFDRCANIKDYNFRQFNDDVWNYINTKDIEKVVVDMRYNMGGMSSVFDPFRSGLLKNKEYNDPNKLFVLVGNRTFSSGVASAAITKRWTNATLVGEPTGGKPNSYGDGVRIELPNSGVIISCSSNYYEFYPGYGKNTLIPDVIINRTINDYKASNDPVYQFVVEK